MTLVYDSAYPFAVRTTNTSRFPTDELTLRWSYSANDGTTFVTNGIDIPVHLVTFDVNTTYGSTSNIGCETVTTASASIHDLCGKI